LSLLLVLLIWGCSNSSERVLESLPGNSDPATVGKKIIDSYISGSSITKRGDKGLTEKITQKEILAWVGAIRFAEKTNDGEILQQLKQRYYPLLGREKHLVPDAIKIEETVFGALLMQLFLNSFNDCFYYLGVDYADRQWELPKVSDITEESSKCANIGLSWQSRFRTDDMYMISLLQTRAFLASGKKKYLNRAAFQMVAYIDSLQQSNGLFIHGLEAPYYWGRGNGWMAAAMTELLLVLPENNIHQAQIMETYQKLMKALLRFRNNEGIWNQLIDERSAWTETSGSAMFIYAIFSGVKHGWLDKDIYERVVRKAWISLLSYLNENGELRGICQDISEGASKEYYLERKKVVGDLYGQAALLWCTAAMIQD
jgi:unsaturated rhamnogalacturonyl hydrolase